MKESGSSPCDSSVELLALATSADAVVGTVITLQCILVTYLIIPMLHPLYMYNHVCMYYTIYYILYIHTIGYIIYVIPMIILILTTSLVII